MSEVRILLGSARSAVAEDHQWVPVPNPDRRAPELLDALPAVERYAVVVPVERVRIFRLVLPPGSRRKVIGALPFLVEERLVEPLEHYEFVLLDGGAAGRPASVAVFERDWLAGVRSALGRVDRGEMRWSVEGWGWPPAGGDPAGWRLRVADGRAVLHRGGPDVTRLPYADLATGLDLALDEAGAVRPATLDVHMDDADPMLAAVRRWGAAQNVEIRLAELPDVWQADAAATPWMLFRQSRSKTRQAMQALALGAVWRPAFAVAVALLAIEMVAGFAHWAMQESRIGSLQKEAHDSFRAVAGPSAVVVDPLLQMRRLYQARQHAEGQSTADDFLPLLATVTRELPSAVGRAVEVGYEGGRLRLAFDAAGGSVPAAAAESIRLLRLAGWQVAASVSADQKRWTLQVGRT